MMEFKIKFKTGGEELYVCENMDCYVMDDFEIFMPDVSVVQLATLTYFPRTPLSSVSILVLNGKLCE